MIQETGKKIKYLRKKYKITQKELCGNFLTPSMLSYIENGKSKLTENIAENIVKSFNEVFKKRNINDKISVDWIMKSTEDQVKEFVNNCITKVIAGEKICFETVNRVFINHHIIDEKIRLYSFLGSYYYNTKKNVTESKKYFEEILSLIIKNPENQFYYFVIFQMQRIYSALNDFKESKLLYEKLDPATLNDKNNITGYINFYFSLAFHVLKYYNQAILLLQKAMKQFDKDDAMMKCENNIGICYSIIGDHEKAIYYFQKILDRTPEEFWKSSAYSNILVNAVKGNDIILLKNTIPKLERLYDIIPIKERNQVSYCLGIAYLHIEDRYNAMLQFERELTLDLDLASHQFFLEKYEKSIIVLLDLYNKGDIKKLKKLEELILEIPNEVFKLEFALRILKQFFLLYSKSELMRFYNLLEKKLGLNNKIDLF